jgi:hypothetical protein
MEESMIVLGIFGLLAGVAIFALWIWALIDIIRSTFNDIAIKIVWFLLVFFLPLLGFVLYAMLGKSTKVPEAVLTSNQKYDDLERVKKLYDNGVLNEEEYVAEKTKIMAREG